MERRKGGLGTLVVVAALGLGHLAYPFGGDQALFTVAARDLSQGAILYRDFWDFKQPGIFAFYAAAGRLFGFDEVGIHVFELGWMLTLAVVLSVTTRRWLQSSLIAGLAPLLTVGNYYVVSESWHLTQVEGLVGLPMYLALWYAWTPPGASPRPWRLVVAGVMGGCVLLFKFMFLPILVAGWLTAIASTVRPGAPTGRGLTALAAPILVGALCPLAVMAGYFAWTQTLGLAAWTWFSYPGLVVREIPMPSAWRLLGALEWFARSFAWLIALSVIGAAAALRRQADALALSLIWWLGLGAVVILVQVQSWWPYHFHLLLVPIGLLAAIGVDALCTWIRTADPFMATRRGTVVMLLALVLLLSPDLGLMVRKTMPLLEERPAWSPDSRLRYQQSVSAHYRTVRGDVAFLREPGSLPGRIHVFGDPLYYFLSDRGQAIPLNGWFMEMALAEQWREVAAQLEAARPPYIFVASVEGGLIERRAPALTAVLRSAYQPLHESRSGRWYVRASR